MATANRYLHQSKEAAKNTVTVGAASEAVLCRDAWRGVRSSEPAAVRRVGRA